MSCAKNLRPEAAVPLGEEAGASLEIVPRLAHQIDKHILERGLGSLPIEVLAFAIRQDGGFECSGVATGHMQTSAERRHHVDARLARKLICKCVEAFARFSADEISREMRRFDHLVDRTMR